MHGPGTISIKLIFFDCLLFLDSLQIFILILFTDLPISDCMSNEEKRNAIQKCADTQKGTELVIGHGNYTDQRINPLYYVPSIEIDEVRRIMLYNGYSN